MDSNTASNTEHKNDTDSANNRYNITNSIYDNLPIHLHRDIKIMIVSNDNIIAAYDKLTPDLQKVIAGV